jgi:cyclopropane fatty-acyl-phospholipid synthase-like methyltransferase
MNRLLTDATDPRQYDVIDWAREAKGLRNPMRAFFWSYLVKELRDLKDKSLLDIGSGTGWLLDLALKNGAKLAIGIEPSIRNYKTSQQLYPSTTTVNTTFENYSSNTQFDYITGLLSVIHIMDLRTAFAKMKALLTKNGRVILIVSDYDYWKRPRYDYQVEIEDINDDEFVSRTTRSFGTLTSIVRKVKKYEELAQKARLALEKHVSMIPTPELIEKEPKYQAMQDSPIMHLLIFK